MINKMVSDFNKVNEDRKLFIFYTCIALPILFIAQAIKFPLFLNYGLALIIIGFIMYIHVCKRIKVKFFSKQIFMAFTNIFNYIEYKDSFHKKYVINYLKKRECYTKTKILFIINYLQSRKEPKLKRDWLTLVLTIVLTILIASFNNGKVDYEIFKTIFAQYVSVIIILVILYFSILYSIKWIYNGAFSNKSSTEFLESILTDLYLEMKR